MIPRFNTFILARGKARIATRLMLEDQECWGWAEARRGVEWRNAALHVVGCCPRETRAVSRGVACWRGLAWPGVAWRGGSGPGRPQPLSLRSPHGPLRSPQPHLASTSAVPGCAHPSSTAPRRLDRGWVRLAGWQDGLGST